MKKAFSLLAVFMVAVMWSATGFSADKYVSGNIGISWMNDISRTPTYTYEGDDYRQSVDTGSGISLNGAFGYDYGDYRIEAELGYQTNDIETMTFLRNGDGETQEATGDVSVTSLMANAYYDIDLGGNVEFYLTTGIGVAQIDIDDVAPEYSENRFFNTSETAFAYQLGAGLAIPVSDGIMLDARYRYLATTDFTIGGESPLVKADYFMAGGENNGNIESHSALLGLRVNL